MLDKILQAMDNCYLDYLSGDINRDKFQNQMAKCLSSLPLKNKKHFEVAIVNQTHKEPFFGMRIYPVMNSLNAITDEFINEKISFRELCKKWETIEDWYIEIDAISLDRSLINFSPKELTAITLHEVGHTLYSDEPVEKFYRAYQEAKSRVKLSDAGVMKVLYSLYTIPLAIACMQHTWINEKNEVAIEFFADHELTKLGYGDAMVTALDKILKAFGTDNETDSAKEQKIKNSVIWCQNNIEDITRRRDKLKDELFYQSVKSTSPYFKALCVKLLNTLGVRMRERYSGSVVDVAVEHVSMNNPYEQHCAFIDDCRWAKLMTLVQQQRTMPTNNNCRTDSIATESFKKNKIPTLPEQYDVDRISVEIDKIDNHYDRVYVLDLIHGLTQRIDTFESTVCIDPSAMRKYKTKIAQLRKELDDCRKRCLAKTNPGAQYRLFVKYPEGYEG